MNNAKSIKLTRNSQIRLTILGAIVIIFFSVLLIQLFNLQIVENLVWENKAKAFSSRSETLLAQRGSIWDRNVDKPLAVNIDSFTLSIIPAQIPPLTPAKLSLLLAEHINNTPESIMEKIPGKWENSWQPVEIKDGLDFETLVPIAESSEDYPGVVWERKPYRWYNSLGTISHVLGYMGKITVEEVQILYNRGYSNTSSLGKIGVEKVYDGILRGKNGSVMRTVDVSGRDLGVDDDISPPTNGADIVLTIDRNVQELAEKALGPRKGALIVLKPSSGEILAMVSYPSFNPNLFYTSSDANFNALSLNADFPFLNRSIQSGFAPASTFKLIMYAAILGEKAINPAVTIECRGSKRFGNRDFRCHKRTGHGFVNLQQALEQSCNIYFGTVGIEYLGIDVISRYARAFGLGSSSGIDLEGDFAGLVPDKLWKERTYNVPWTGGDTLNASIGQGFLNATPLQVANMVAGIVNEGVIYKPKLLKEVRKSGSNIVVYQNSPDIMYSIDMLKPSDYRQIKRAMRGVVKRGTGQWAIYTRTVDVAGKTGTGEIGIDGHWNDWFVAFAPYTTSDPEERIVVVAIIDPTENYEWWAPKAVDIVMEGYFSRKTYEEVIAEWQRRRVWWSWDNREIPTLGNPVLNN